MLSANPSIKVRGLNRVRYNFDERGPENLSNLPGRLRCAHFVWAHQYFPHGKRTGAKLILPFLHFRENVAHTFGIAGMVLKSVDKYHRVPVNSAHWFWGAFVSLRYLLGFE